MALEYALYIDTDRHPKQLLERMFAGLGIKACIEKAGGFVPIFRGKPQVFRSADGPGFITSAYKTGDLRRDFLMEELELDLSVTIQFRLSKFKDLETQKRTLLQATIELLRQVEGDAVLLFNGEVVWLLRKAGELTLNSAMNLWKPEFLNLVNLPYKMKEIPIL